MTKYCDTCKKPIPEGLTHCPSCHETVLLDAPAAGGPADPSDISWSDLVNDAASVGEPEQTLIELPDDEARRRMLAASDADQTLRTPRGEQPATPASDPDEILAAEVEEELPAAVVDEPEETFVANVIDEPAEEPLTAAVVDEPEEPLVANVVDEPAEEPLTAAVVDEADEPLVGQVVDEPAEEPLTAAVVNEPQEPPLTAQVVDEPAGDALVAQVVDEQEPELKAQVVDEPAEELTAQVVDEPEEEELVAQVADEPAEEEIAAALADEPVEEKLAQVVDEPGEDEAAAALVEDEPTLAAAEEAELVAEVADDAKDAAPADDTTVVSEADDADADINLGAPVEAKSEGIDELAAEAGGTPGESMLDDVFLSGQLPIEESTSAVDLGSSSVLEIPNEILEAVEQQRDDKKATKKPAPDETRIELTSMPEKKAEEVLELGEVGEAKDKTVKESPKPGPKPSVPAPLPKTQKTKLGKKAIPTQLVSESDDEIEATIAEEPAPKKAPAPAPAQVHGEETELLETVDEFTPAEEPVEEEVTALVDEDVGFADDEPVDALRKHGKGRLAEAEFGGDVFEEPKEMEVAEEEVAVSVAEDEENLAGLAEGEAEAPKAKKLAPVAKAKTTKPRYGRRWLAGISLGLLLGALGYLGLWAYNVQPLDQVDQLQSLRDLTGAKTSKASSSSLSAPKPKDDPHALLADGQFSKAIEAFDTAKPTSAKDLAAQGEATWLAYLQKQKKNAIKADAAEVKAAVELFDKARAAGGASDEDTAAKAQALFWLAQIDERTDNAAKAREKYTQGAKDYPKQKAMFQAQLDRMTESGGADASALFRDDPNALAMVLAYMLVGFKADGSGDATDEAAPDFFQALLLAQGGNFDDALKKVESARKIHDEQRFNRLKKAQNPKSDPLEESFLRTCDELKTYIEVRRSLKNNGYLDGGKVDVTKVETALKEASEAAKAAKAVAKQLKDAKLADDDLPKAVESLIKEHGTLEDVKGKLKDAKLDDTEVAKSVDTLLTEHATLDNVSKQLKKAELNDKEIAKSVESLIKEHDTLQSVTKQLKDNKIDETDVPKSVDGLIQSRKQVEAITADLDKAGIKDKDPVKGVAGAINQRDQFNDQLLQTVKKIEVMKMLPSGSKVADLDKGLTMIADILNKEDKLGRIREMLASSEKEVRERKAELVKLEDQRVSQLKAAEDRRLKETGDLKAILAERHPPQEMLDFWSSLLPDRNTREEQSKAALKDVERVRNEKESKAADKGRAFLIEGLAQRNLGDYDKARKSLKEAVDYDSTPPDAAKSAERALAELSDPGVYYFSEVNRAIFFGKFDQATALLDQAAKVFPDEKGQLNFQRGLLLFEKARADAGDKPLKDDDAVVTSVRDAAKAAGDAGNKAEAAYLLGRLEEELGKLPLAREQFDQAVKLTDEKSPKLATYQLALARVLWRIHRATPAPVGPRLGLANQAGPFAEFVALFADDVEKLPPGVTKEGKQADEIAKELEKTLPKSEFLLKAQALGIQGRWDEALKTYVEGMQGHMRRDQLDALMLIVENHPGLRMPPSAEVPNPKVAGQYWATGLTHYWARRYFDAEKSFFEACKYDSQDARYHYFLGLALWQQNLPAKQDLAKRSFEEGGKLERSGRPASDAVNASLERVQGELRQKINEYRP